MKKNPFTTKKPIMEGDAILSSGSLPEKESKRKQAEKIGPFIPQEKVAKNSKESTIEKKDIDIGNMTSLLGEKE